MNPNPSGSEIPGGSSVETTPVEVQPLQMPVEDQPQKVENPETTGQIVPPEQVQATPLTTQEAQPVQQPALLSDAEKTHQLHKAVRGDVNSLSEASQLVEAISFED